MLEKQHQSTNSVGHIHKNQFTNNEYQFVTIPKYFLDLTKLNVGNEKRLRTQVYTLINKYPDLQYILKLIHPDEKKLNFIELVNRYNFDHLLELIISSIIEKKINGNYLKSPDLGHAIQIEKQCQRLRPKSFSSGPRLTLLFVYLTLNEISLGNTNATRAVCHNFVERVSPYLDHVNTNIYEADWMLLTLSLLDNYLGQNLLMTHLKNETPLTEVIKHINLKSQKEFFISLINYANSIEEEHLLYQDFI